MKRQFYIISFALGIAIGVLRDTDQPVLAWLYAGMAFVLIIAVLNGIFRGVA